VLRAVRPRSSWRHEARRNGTRLIAARPISEQRGEEASSQKGGCRSPALGDADMHPVSPVGVEDEAPCRKSSPIDDVRTCHAELLVKSKDEGSVGRALDNPSPIGAAYRFCQRDPVAVAQAKDAAVGEFRGSKQLIQEAAAEHCAEQAHFADFTERQACRRPTFTNEPQPRGGDLDVDITAGIVAQKGVAQALPTAPLRTGRRHPCRRRCTS
jgi:hypothetical protein